MPRRPLVAQPEFAPKAEPPLAVRAEFAFPKPRPRKRKPRKIAPIQAVSLRVALPSKRTVSPTERARECEQKRNDRMWGEAIAQQRHALRAQRRAYRRANSSSPLSEATPLPQSPND